MNEESIWNNPSGSQAYNLLLDAITDAISTTTSDYNLFKSYQFAVFRPLTLAQEAFRYRSKGCSKFYLSQINSYICSNHITEPPGRNSAQSAYNITIPKQAWSSAIKKTMRAVVSPSSIDLSYKIFLRQNWTPVKQSLATKDPNKATCVYCGHLYANTQHMYLDCHIASDLWSMLNKLIYPTFHYRIQTTPQQILFHQNISTYSHSVDRVILDLIISCKSILQTIAFRDILLPPINQYSLKSMFFNKILSTIHANRLSVRLVPYYHSLHTRLLSQYEARIPISFT